MATIARIKKMKPVISLPWRFLHIDCVFRERSAIELNRSAAISSNERLGPKAVLCGAEFRAIKRTSDLVQIGWWTEVVYAAYPIIEFCDLLFPKRPSPPRDRLTAMCRTIRQSGRRPSTTKRNYSVETWRLKADVGYRLQNEL
jgi:hypothetical protein